MKDKKEREIITIPKAWIEFKVDGVKKNYLCNLEVVKHIEWLTEELKDYEKSNEMFEQENDGLIQRVNELAEAMQWFVDRCDLGEVRSRKTYARFKELLNK